MAVYTTIDDPSAYFKVHLYTGTGSSNAQTFADTDTDMQPDMVWIKCRSNSGTIPRLTDSVRGVTKEIYSSETSAEDTETNGLTAFGSDGFTVGSNGDYNASTRTFVAWCWKAGTTSGITTTNSTITPSAYSFNATSGVSIVTYTGNDTAGAKVPHGLGVAPELVIVKTRGGANSWVTMHHAYGATKYMYLDTTAAVGTNSTRWNDTNPTQYNVVLGGGGNTNGSGGDSPILMLSFVGKQGFSKFGSYEGNSNTDGPFVYTGFRPAYLMIKNIDRSEAWNCFDATRNPSNLADNPINLNDTAAEITSTSKSLDILSNGFKIRGTSTELNHSTLIYAAFAQAPFVNSNGVPCNAR